MDISNFLSAHRKSPKKRLARAAMLHYVFQPLEIDKPTTCSFVCSIPTLIALNNPSLCVIGDAADVFEFFAQWPRADRLPHVHWNSGKVV